MTCLEWARVVPSVFRNRDSLMHIHRDGDLSVGGKIEGGDLGEGMTGPGVVSEGYFS